MSPTLVVLPGQFPQTLRKARIRRPAFVWWRVVLERELGGIEVSKTVFIGDSAGDIEALGLSQNILRLYWIKVGHGYGEPHLQAAGKQLDAARVEVSC